MRLILDCHSNVECYDEESSYAILEGLRRSDGARELTGFKVPQLTEQLADPCLKNDVAVRLGEQGVRNSYGGDKLIFMVRDPRDAVASMLGPSNWFRAYGESVLRAKTRNEPQFASKYRHELAICAESPYDAVSRAALIWRYKVDVLWNYLDRGFPLQLVRYESLVTSPRSEMSDVCRFLGLQLESQMMNHSAMNHRDLREDGLATGNTDPRRPIHVASIGKWQNRFQPAEIRAILQIAGVAQDRLYSNVCIPQFNR